MKKKILVTTGTRADYGILRPLLTEIKKNKKFDLFLIVCGMHLSKKHGMTINEIKKDGFKIYSKIEIMPKGNDGYFMAESLGNGIVKFSKVIKKLKPDINIILGDRGEALASAVAAFHMNIPNVHISGGDKTQGGIDEYIRHAITKISNIHFATTKKSMDRIIKMGENSKYVFHTGSLAIDEIMNHKITKKNELEKKYKIKFTGKEIILLQHPVTTEPELSKKHILETLRALTKIKETVIAILPNSDAGNKEISENLKLASKNYKNFMLYPNLPREDFFGMLKNGGVLIGNSSSGIVESAYFHLPVINIGMRQKGREKGSNVYDVDFSSDAIHKLIIKCIKIQKKKNNHKFIYGKGNTAKKIIKILENIEINKNLIQKQITI
jgi:GDP/UDP-N,N'-diacetylbacillosamine 2-epimerase (hydrolysing)